MKHTTRKAEFEANLIIIDEPQVICLNAGKTKVVALAVPYSEKGDFNFIATSVSSTNWERYLDSAVDLRYLFTYPFNRANYTFNIRSMQNKTIRMSLYDGAFPEKFLPAPQIFASDHTEEYGLYEAPDEAEHLFIDGEWEMPEFGKFYQKYSDLYAFNAAVTNAWSEKVDSALRARIRRAFVGKPFKGGSSYVNLFDDLELCLPRRERLTLDAIKYESPGDVRMNGSSSLFAGIRILVGNYLENRAELHKAYNELQQHLSKRRLLTRSAEHFTSNEPGADYIHGKARELSDKLMIGNFEQITSLCLNNPLVVAKVVLAMYRRIESASSYFAQGRMAFEME